MVTKLNVNIRTLLTNCEELAKDEANYWRLRKFIKSLSTMIDELKGYEDPTSMLKISSYTKRLEALKTLTNFTDTLPVHSENRSVFETSNDALKEIRQLQTSKQYTDMRKELISDSTLRHRKQEDVPITDNVKESSNYYSKAQENIAEHMLSLTRNLKEQTKTANRIIRSDTEVVGHSAGMADHNINSLQKETEKLADHSRNAYKCWMWMMFLFVVAVFVGMVLFMKIVKKKKS